MMPVFSLAFASAPLLYSGDATKALQGASMDLGSLASELAPLPPEGASRGAGLQLLGATPRSCSGPALDGQTMLPEVRRWTSLALDLRWEEVVAQADKLSASLACLSTPLNPDAVPELYFIAGVAAGELGNVAKAKAYFRRALDFNPSIRWHADYGIAAKPAFEAVAATVGSSTNLRLGPGSEGLLSLRIDGASRPVVDGVVVLTEGEHVIQTEAGGLMSWVVEFGSRPLALAVPDQVLAASGGLVESEAGRPVLDAALSQLEPGSSVVVWTGSHTYRRGPDGTWAELPGVANAAAGRARGKALVTIGLPIAAAGGLFTLAEYMAGRRFGGDISDGRCDCPGLEAETRNDLISDFRPGMIAGSVVGAAGLGTTIAGAVMLTASPRGLEVKGSWSEGQS